MIKKGHICFGYIPPHALHQYLHSGNGLTKFADLYLRLFGLPEITQRTRFSIVSKFLNADSTNWALDIGCGYGLVTAWLGSMGAQAVGIDTEVEKIKLAKSIIEGLNLRKKVFYVIASACNLPFRNELFDTILSLDVIEHISNDLEVASEASRVLKLRGVFILTTPCLKQRYGFRSEVELGQSWGHVRKGYTLEALQALLNRQGLHLVAIKFWLKRFAVKVFDFHFRFLWERRAKANLALAALVFPFMWLLVRLDEIFYANYPGNEFVLKAIKLNQSGVNE